MGAKKQLPVKGKRENFVLFLSSLIPTLKLNSDGELELEFGVVDFLAEKALGLISKRKKKKKNQKEGEGQELKAGDSNSEEEEQENPESGATADDTSKGTKNGAAKDAAKETDEAAKETAEEEKEEIDKAGDDKEDKGTKQEEKDIQYSRKAEDQQLEESLEATVQKSKPDTTWDSVAGLQNAKWQLQIAAELPERQPALFRGKRKAPQFILLYGPPGTGKGHLAKALCNSVDSTLFIVSASDMTSKYSGESERLVRLLFKRARRHKPAIVFFDEIDALCSSRRDDSADHEIRIKNEFLVQMDGLNHDNSGVLFLAATNRPWNIDAAFIRRFQKRIEVPLPDEGARTRLFELEVGGTLCDLSQDDYKKLATQAEGFSGSDIKTVVQDALNFPVIRVIEATHFSEDAQHNFSPCVPSSGGAIQMNWRDIPKGKLGDLPVTRQDFFNALRQAKPSVDPDGLEKYETWTAKHGMIGA